MTRAKFARIITMRAKPGRGTEFVSTFRDEVASTAVQLKGLRRLYLFRRADKEDDFMVLSLWDDAKHAEAYAKSGKDRDYTSRLARVQRGKERVRKFRLEVDIEGEIVQLRTRLISQSSKPRKFSGSVHAVPR
jgi:heme-degrading monooxygenase HmoA